MSCPLVAGRAACRRRDVRRMPDGLAGNRAGRGEGEARRRADWRRRLTRTVCPAASEAYEIRVAHRVPVGARGWALMHRCTIPHEVELDRWPGAGAVLNKGCYRGQRPSHGCYNLGRPPRMLVIVASGRVQCSGRRRAMRCWPAVARWERLGTVVEHVELGPGGTGPAQTGLPGDTARSNQSGSRGCRGDRRRLAAARRRWAPDGRQRGAARRYSVTRALRNGGQAAAPDQAAR